MSEPLKNLDRFEHEGVTGRGSFADVKRYLDKETGDKVAIKILKSDLVGNDDSVHRFEREIEILRELGEHENIISLKEFGTVDGRPFYVMSLADANLENYVKSNNSKMTLEKRLYIFEQIIAAISFAHSKNIQHRDLSPKNILVVSENDAGAHICVSDFGLGKNWKDDSGYTKSDVKHYGSFDYTPPEQHEGLNDVTPRGDVYSLGKLLYFILTGRRPVDSQTESGFRIVIEQATQTDPNSRYATVESLKESFLKIKDILVIEPSEDGSGSETGFKSSGGEVNWKRFHAFAVKGDFTEHVYPEYIGIVVELLSSNKNLQAYYNLVGDAFVDAMNTLQSRLGELPLNGWPFEALNKIAHMYWSFWNLSKNNQDMQLFCFSRLWHFAYRSDRFNARRYVSRILVENLLPESLHERGAAVIATSDAKVPKDHLTDSRIPAIFAKAIDKVRS